MLRIHDILVRIRIRLYIHGSVPLTNGSRSGSGSCGSDSFSDFYDARKIFYFFLHIFSYNLPTGTLSSVSKIKFFAKIFVKILFCTHYFSPLNTFMSSVADPGCLSQIPDPDFYPSRIPDLGSRIQKQQQKRGVKKDLLSYLFL